MAYLPAERIAFEADLFDTHEPPPAAPTPAMRSFFNQVRTHEARRRDDRAGARPIRAVELVRESDGSDEPLARQDGWHFCTDE